MAGMDPLAAGTVVARGTKLQKFGNTGVKTTAVPSGGTSVGDQISLGGNGTPDFAKMRQIKKQRFEQAQAKFNEVMGIDPNNPPQTPTRTSTPAPKPENKSWLDKLTEGGRLARSRGGKSRIRAGGGSWGVQNEGSNTILWSDGDVTMTKIHAWEKMNYK